VKSVVIEVGKGEVVVPVTFLAEYFDKSVSTVANWKKLKNLPLYDTKNGKNRFELISTIEWKKANLKDKFSPNKRVEISEDGVNDEDFRIDLPFGMQIGTIDLNNSQHLGVLALHPFGEMIRDTLKAREDIVQKRIKTAEIRKDLIPTKDAFRNITEVTYGLRSSMQSMLRNLPKELADKKTSDIKELLSIAFKSSLESVRDIDNCLVEEDEKMFDVIELVNSLFVQRVSPSVIMEKLKELSSEQ